MAAVFIFHQEWTGPWISSTSKVIGDFIGGKLLKFFDVPISNFMSTNIKFCSP